MAFQVSPGINVTEIDLTTVVPAVSTSVAAVAGVFNWGPVESPVLVSTETQLVSNFGKPSDTNYETFYSAANFLAYSTALYVSRAADLAENAIGGSYANSTVQAAAANVVIKNSTDFESFSTNDASLMYAAKFPGALGNSLKVSEVKAENEYSKSISLLSSTLGGINTALKIPAAATVTAAVGASSIRVLLTKSDAGITYAFNTFTGVTGGSDDKITLPSGHDFVVGDRVVYKVSTAATLVVGGLTDNNVYFVVDRDATSVKLGLTAGGEKIDLTAVSFDQGDPAVATGELHTLTKVGTSGLTLIDAGTYLTALKEAITIGSKIQVGNSTIGLQKMTIQSVSNTSSDTNNVWIDITTVEKYKLSTNFSGNTVDLFWEYSDLADDRPTSTSYALANPINGVVKKDEITIVVTDEGGKFTGVPGTVLEVFTGLSRAKDARATDGATLFYKNVINDTSRYIWAIRSETNDDNLVDLNTVVNDVTSKPSTFSLTNGLDGSPEATISMGKIAAAYDVYKDPQSTDISLVITGKPRGINSESQLAQYIIDNIVESRMDCVAFVSPPKTANAADQLTKCIDFRNALSSTSYAVMDSGYKYQYDKYNDVYRYVPLNGDIAGLAARTDDVRDPWFSPAGFNRGTIRNMVKLWWNPDKASRDELYKKGINPVVTFPGQGTVLYGDKTLLATPSAFDRINVRRLFIVLEKAIANAAQSSLFEFNDEFTRTQFKNLVEPFLREVQGRRGIYDFRVVCDESNNTGQVIDSNRFVGDIYIKPAKAINFIQLNFVAVRSGVEFTEFVGQF
jgi:phage tail sheath protein FI